MRQITSRDGTSIACQQSEKGPALVLVHGVLGSSIRWPILAALEDHFAVYAMERRGRGRRMASPKHIQSATNWANILQIIQMGSLYFCDFKIFHW